MGFLKIWKYALYEKDMQRQNDDEARDAICFKIDGTGDFGAFSIFEILQSDDVRTGARIALGEVCDIVHSTFADSSYNS